MSLPLDLVGCRGLLVTTRMQRKCHCMATETGSGKVMQLCLAGADSH